MQIEGLSWFPGHMTKTKRMIAAEIGHMDAVCEILDARIPLSSRNPDVDEMTAGKPRLVVLNRVDQADPRQTKRWAVWFREKGYAVLEEDGKFGLYSFAERRQILPCRYDQLITNPNGVDDYVMNGYVAVEVDGKRYYADIYNDGALSEPIDDTGRGFAQYGCVYAWRQEARSVLMAADGFTQTTRHAYLDSRGDGYLLVYQMDSYYGVMTWHGRDVLNTYTKCIVLTDDGKMICDTTRHGYQLLELTQDDRRALPAEP